MNRRGAVRAKRNPIVMGGDPRAGLQQCDGLGQVNGQRCECKVQRGAGCLRLRSLEFATACSGCFLFRAVFNGDCGRLTAARVLGLRLGHSSLHGTLRSGTDQGGEALQRHAQQEEACKKGPAYPMRGSTVQYSSIMVLLRHCCSRQYLVRRFDPIGAPETICDRTRLKDKAGALYEITSLCVTSDAWLH